jgi:hypothetical protein
MFEYDKQLVEAIAEVKSFDSSPHSNYNETDAAKLYQENTIYIEGIIQIIRLYNVLYIINFNYVSTGKRLSSLRCDKMDWYASHLQDILATCLELYTEYQESVFDAKTLVETTIDLIKSPLGDTYQHQVIPILVSRCIEAIQNGIQHLICSKKMVKRENQKRKWICPICHESVQKDVIWLVSEEKGHEACSHSFHKQCFLQGYESSKQCELCHREITKIATYCVNHERVF